MKSDPIRTKVFKIFDKDAKRLSIIYSISSSLLLQLLNNQKMENMHVLKVAIKFNDFIKFEQYYPNKIGYSNFWEDATFLPYYKQYDIKIYFQLLVPSTENKFNLIDKQSLFESLKNKPSFFNYISGKNSLEIGTLVDMLYDQSPEYWILIDDHEPGVFEIETINFKSYKYIKTVEELELPYFTELAELYKQKTISEN